MGKTAEHTASPKIGTEPAKIRGLENEGMHAVESFDQICNAHWTTPRNKRHAGAWARTDSPKVRQLEAHNRSGAGDHFVQHFFAPQGVSLVSGWQPVERFVEPCPLFVLKHAAIGFHRPCSFFPFRVWVPRATSVEGPLCRAMYGTEGWMEFSSFATSIILFHTTKKS